MLLHSKPRGGNGTPLQYSCLENPMCGGAWLAAVHGVAKCQTRCLTERLHFHFSLSCIGEGNGNPLQCSCMENPRDGGAWWAAVCGVAQSQTQLKRLSSSSSILNLGLVTWHEAVSPRQGTSLIRLRNVLFGSAVAFEYRRENYRKKMKEFFITKTNIFFF